MSYNEDGYRIEKYERDDETFFQIRFEIIDVAPIRAIISIDGVKSRFETEEEAREFAEKEVERHDGW